MEVRVDYCIVRINWHFSLPYFHQKQNDEYPKLEYAIKYHYPTETIEGGLEAIHGNGLDFDRDGSAIAAKKNDGQPFPLMITIFYRVDLGNIVDLDMDVLPKKTITEEVIERYGKVNSFEDIEDERKRVEIARREIK
ncbi:hypothetical protein Syun_004087 [Stephania yunnanensis]|uniref:Uncharacterized protein n=1 Tax=Stephania yunnanensis TaxID=152371 RepID=A0AAP0L4X8_9MAGN